MLSRYLILLSFFFFGFSGLAQKQGEPLTDSLFYMGYVRDSIAALGPDRLMIVPFHPDRYMSEIDRSIGEAGGYNFQQVRGFWRKGLNNALVIASKESSVPIDMHADKGAINMDLDFIYKVLGYDYREYKPAPANREDLRGKEKLAYAYRSTKEKLKHEENGPAPGARIEEGQLVHVADNREKLTVAKVFNPLLFDSLGPKYGAQHYLFINEFNILNAPESPHALQSGKYNRVLVVHYSIYNADGTEWYSEMEKTYFSSHESNLRNIISTYFVEAANAIVRRYDSKRFELAGLKAVAFLPVAE